MKKIIVLLIVTSISILGYSQEKNLDFNSEVNEHLKEFRTTVGKKANVFIVFDYDFKDIDLEDYDYILQPYINPKKLKDENNYMVKFIVSSEGNQMILRAINFRIKKISRKKIEFINLMNGKDYK